MQRNVPVPNAKRPLWRRLLRALCLTLVVFVVGSVLLVLALRWIPPPTSAFMLHRRVEAWLGNEPGFALHYQWMPAAQVSTNLPIALVAAEDQKFPQHHGFDLESIEDAWSDRASGKRTRGASTISQQVAKNLFLWPARSWVRKGFEVYFTALIEALWSKSRILEVYCNVAEFGNGIYGAEAASQAYFRRPASALSARQAATLAAVLPNPRQLHADRPTRYVWTRVLWIERQVRQLGGASYLQPVPPQPAP